MAIGQEDGNNRLDNVQRPLFSPSQPNLLGAAMEETVQLISTLCKPSCHYKVTAQQQTAKLHEASALRCDLHITAGVHLCKPETHSTRPRTAMWLFTNLHRNT